jgi:hypothetical protein
VLVFDVPHLDRHSGFDGKSGLSRNSDSPNRECVSSAPHSGPYIDGLEDLTAPLADRQSYSVLFAYYMRLTALNVDMCMAQHLSLSAVAQTGRSIGPPTLCRSFPKARFLALYQNIWSICGQPRDMTNARFAKVGFRRKEY